MDENQLLLKTILSKLDTLDIRFTTVTETVNCLKVDIETISGHIDLIEQRKCPRDPYTIKEIVEVVLLKRDIKKPAKIREIFLWFITILNGGILLWVTFTKLI